MTSADIAAAVADLVEIGELERGTPLAEVRDLAVIRPRDLSGLDELPGLRTLSVVGAPGVPAGAFAPLRELEVLAVECSAYHPGPGDVPPGVRVLVLRSNRVRSLAPLDALPRLQVADVSGNPLDDDADAVLERWRERGVVVTADDAAVRELNRRLAAPETGLACTGTSAACTLTATGQVLAPDPDRVAVATDAAEVAGALDAGTLDALLARQVR